MKMKLYNLLKFHNEEIVLEAVSMDEIHNYLFDKEESLFLIEPLS